MFGLPQDVKHWNFKDYFIASISYIGGLLDLFIATHNIPDMKILGMGTFLSISLFQKSYKSVQRLRNKRTPLYKQNNHIL